MGGLDYTTWQALGLTLTLLRLVFSPVVWVGVVLAGVSVVLFVVTGLLRRRGGGSGAGRAPARGRVTAERSTPSASAARSATADEGLDDDIETILRRHGIS